jgi:hypothetical protein
MASHREQFWDETNLTIRRTGSMNPSEEFLRHAADCQRMAKFSRDPASRATWNRMAERWLRCAETFNRESAAAKPVHRHRKGAADMQPYREAG